MNKQPETLQYTDSSADQIDREMHREMDQRTPEPNAPPKTATFSLTPYGQVLVHVVDEGYPREAIIDMSLLVRHVLTAIDRGFQIIDHTGHVPS